MPEAIDTVTADEAVTETEALEVNGTTVEESTEAEAIETKDEVEQTETKAEPDELEKLRKELNKAQMEINQRRNKEKELDEARNKAEIKALEDEGKFKELAEKYAQDAETRATAERQKEAEDFRSKIFDEYGAEVADKAKKLGLYWDDAPDFETAGAQLRAKLDVLKGDTAISTPKDDTEIHPNNPSSLDDKSKTYASLDEELEALRKELGRAPQR